MIPFVLGVITGFLAAVLLMVIYDVVTKSSSEMSRKEESWNEEKIMDESDK